MLEIKHELIIIFIKAGHNFQKSNHSYGQGVLPGVYESNHKFNYTFLCKCLQDDILYFMCVTLQHFIFYL